MKRNVRLSNSHSRALAFDLNLKLNNQIDLERKHRKSVLDTGVFKFNNSFPFPKRSNSQAEKELIIHSPSKIPVGKELQLKKIDELSHSRSDLSSSINRQAD